MTQIFRVVPKNPKSTSRGSKRVFRVENLECRTMMSATPLSANTTPATTAYIATEMVQAPVAIESNELHGLSNADKKTLQDIAAFASPIWQSSSTAPSAIVQDGILIIQGCKGNDWVNVVQNGNDVLFSHEVNGKVSNNEWSKKITGAREIVFLAYGGDNVFHNNSHLPSRALGGDGKDYFKGSRSANDVFFGLAGNDELYGWEGSDRLYGGTGNDGLDAGSGSDSEISATNVLMGGDGSDYLIGGRGHDQIFGNVGNDILFDDFGRGVLKGGAGNDVLYIRDYLSPRDTTSTMQGGAGRDQLIAKQGEGSFFAWNKDKYVDNAVYYPNQATALSLAEINRLLQWNANQGAVNAPATTAEAVYTSTAAEGGLVEVDEDFMVTDGQQQVTAADARRAQELAAAKSARDQLALQLMDANAALANSKAELSHIRSQINAAESDLELKNSRLEQLHARREELTNTIHSARQALRAVSPKQRASKRPAFEDAEADVTRIEQKLVEVRQERIHICAQLVSLQDQLTLVQARKTETETSIDRLRTDLQAANRRVAQVEGNV